MTTRERDFASQVAALEAMLGSQRGMAVARLRSVCEAWARSLLGIDDAGDLVARVREAVERGVEPASGAQAIEQLGAAEERQWEIGTWSSGAGEGLSSMAEVRALQIAQAWLWTTQGSDDANATETARALLQQAIDDPNKVAARYGESIQALLARLEA